MCLTLCPWDKRLFPSKETQMWRLRRASLAVLPDSSSGPIHALSSSELGCGLLASLWYEIPRVCLCWLQRLHLLLFRLQERGHNCVEQKRSPFEVFLSWKRLILHVSNTRYICSEKVPALSPELWQLECKFWFKMVPMKMRELWRSGKADATRKTCRTGFPQENLQAAETNL